MGIGKRIKELRKKRGMIQSELADRVGVHETTIRRWEKEVDSGPDAAMVIKLADALGTTTESLLSEKPDNREFLTTNQGTDQEKSLVYEWGGTNRLALPNTPETRILFERIVMSLLAGREQPAVAMA